MRSEDATHREFRLAYQELKEHLASVMAQDRNMRRLRNGSGATAKPIAQRPAAAAAVPQPQPAHGGKGASEGDAAAAAASAAAEAELQAAAAAVTAFEVSRADAWPFLQRKGA